MKMIEKIVGQLDVVLAQVLIEAIILEVNLTDGKVKNFGVSFIQNPSTAVNSPARAAIMC